MAAAVGMQKRGVLGTSGILLTCDLAATHLLTLEEIVRFYQLLLQIQKTQFRSGSTVST